MVNALLRKLGATVLESEFIVKSCGFYQKQSIESEQKPMSIDIQGTGISVNTEDNELPQ